MKEYLKNLGKLLFWNFLSAASLGSFLPFMGWALRWGDAQRAIEHRSTFLATFLVEISETLIRIILSGMLFGMLLGMLFLGMWSNLGPSINIWNQHPDKKQKVLLCLSDLIVGIGCWIVVLCYWSQYLAERSWSILGFSFWIFLLPLSFIKFCHLLEE